MHMRYADVAGLTSVGLGLAMRVIEDSTSFAVRTGSSALSRAHLRKIFSMVGRKS